MAQALNRDQIRERLLRVFQSSYNITEAGEEERPLVARCEFYEHLQKYMLSKKAELWSADNEDFLYLFDVPHLTAEIYEQCKNFAYEEGMTKLHIGPGHMASAITIIIICDTCDADAEKALKKTRIHKSFHFSLHGWMNVLTTCVETEKSRVFANGTARNVLKILKRVLYSQK